MGQISVEIPAENGSVLSATQHVAEGHTLSVDAAQGLLLNDFDPDGDAIEATSFSTPAHGTLNVVTDGSFVYTPNAGYVGDDTFTYTISDGTETASATATIDVVSCFRMGTAIRTDRGDVAVEDLSVGDMVLTQAGLAEPIRWVGRRSIDCRRHSRPWMIWPVRVRANAFGDATPCRDLWLSPDHAVFADGVLIPIKHLINRTSIAQVPTDGVTYFHIELSRHDVLLAEGLPAESYLDSGDRRDFETGAAAIALHPVFNLHRSDSALLWEAMGCASLIVTGPKLLAVQQRIDSLSEFVAMAALDGLSVLPAVCAA
jgi:hypothetical protein